jgi:hypothetical protein
MSKIINIYCDESCHLQDTGNDPVMVLGGVYCESDQVKIVSEKIRTIKKKHGFPRRFETKWTKISHSKIEYYKDLIDYFFREAPLRFRGVVIPDKAKLDHERFSQDHDTFYYKMYYTMLLWLFRSENIYHVYLDIKDTRGGQKTKTLQNCLATKICDFNHECVARVQQVRSHESELLQMADLLIGALCYKHRQLADDTPKATITKHLEQYLPSKTLLHSTPYGYQKFNFLVWDAR